jgi:hypothetical protein
MRERCAMKAMAILAMAVLIGVSAPAPAAAQPAAPGAEAEVLVRKPRPRTRLYVRPTYPYRSFHSIYPLPYPVEYPGPNAHRECVGGYVTEHRPSGTVITPRLNCRWVAGRYPGP